MTIRCCVIDDEPLAAGLIAGYVERTDGMELVGTFSQASEAIRTILDGKVDLVFLDIEMPQLGGMEFARLIPPTVRVVFTTAYQQYAVEGFRLNALDYLMKPISYEEFMEAANRAFDFFDEKEEEKEKAADSFLLVKSEYRLVQIRISDILYIQGLKDYIKIHVVGQDHPILTLMSMKTAEQQLPSSFIRVHRSYIVNTARISIVERNQLSVGGAIIPISESYRQQFANYIARHKR